MAYEHLKNAALPRTLLDVVADIADLLQKEMRLAQAEIAAKLSAKLQAGVWMLAAGVLGLMAALLLVAGLVLFIASYGIALHWSCLIVAGVFGTVAMLAFLKGRADAEDGIAPARTLRQLKQDIAVAKEHLS
jgi:hypothetical protein